MGAIGSPIFAEIEGGRGQNGTFLGDFTWNDPCVKNYDVISLIKFLDIFRRLTQKNIYTIGILSKFCSTCKCFLQNKMIPNFFWPRNGTGPHWKKVVKCTRIVCQNVDDVLLKIFVFFLQKYSVFCKILRFKIFQLVTSFALRFLFYRTGFAADDLRLTSPACYRLGYCYVLVNRAQMWKTSL